MANKRAPTREKSKPIPYLLIDALGDYLMGEIDRSVAGNGHNGLHDLRSLVAALPDLPFAHLLDCFEAIDGCAGQKLLFLETWGLCNGEPSLRQFLAGVSANEDYAQLLEGLAQEYCYFARG